jgi:hypothetical protein
VAHELSRRGVEAWLDESEVAAGEAMRDRLEDALRSAGVLVAFVTDTALASPELNFEIGAAVGAEKRVIPVFLSNDVRKDAPSILRERAGIEAVDLKPEQVAEQIADALGAPATTG